MAGHSKWANIQHRKGRQDEKRGKIWTRIIREITVAARAGGGDLGANPRLRLAVERAKAANLPADEMNRATPRLERLYRAWSEGGAGLVITGNVQVDTGEQGITNCANNH